MNDAVCLVTMFFSGFQCRSLYSLKLVRFCHWHELPSATSIIVSWIWAGTDACIRSMFMMPHTCYFQQAHSVHICPISVKEYQITSLSLTAAIANGISVEQIIKVLVKLSKNTIEASQSTKICWGKSWLTRLRYKPRNQVWSRHDFGLQSLSLYWFRDFVVHVFLAFDALTDRHKWKHDNEELAGWSHNMIIHYQYTEDIQNDHIETNMYTLHSILYHQASVFKLVKESPDPCTACTQCPVRNHFFSSSERRVESQGSFIWCSATVVTFWSLKIRNSCDTSATWMDDRA